MEAMNLNLWGIMRTTSTDLELSDLYVLDFFQRMRKDLGISNPIFVCHQVPQLCTNDDHHLSAYAKKEDGSLDLSYA